MTLSKTTLAITLAVLSIGLNACTDSQKESVADAETQAKEVATQAKEKSAACMIKPKQVLLK